MSPSLFCRLMMDVCMRYPETSPNKYSTNTHKHARNPQTARPLGDIDAASRQSAAIHANTPHTERGREMEQIKSIIQGRQTHTNHSPNLSRARKHAVAPEDPMLYCLGGWMGGGLGAKLRMQASR